MLIWSFHFLLARNTELRCGSATGHWTRWARQQQPLHCKMTPCWNSTRPCVSGYWIPAKGYSKALDEDLATMGRRLQSISAWVSHSNGRAVMKPRTRISQISAWQRTSQHQKKQISRLMPRRFTVASDTGLLFFNRFMRRPSIFWTSDFLWRFHPIFTRTLTL